MQFIIVPLLILFNGLLAMAEIAIISARKSKLRHRASEGDKRAKGALELSMNPNKFLSTIQIGITLIGVFAGAFGEATITDSVSAYISMIPFIGDYGRPISFVIVVIVITYLSLIVGEIVPKRIGLAYPEKIAIFMASPMNKLSRISAPMVTVLSATTEWVLKLMRLRAVAENVVEEEEIRHLIKEGAQRGILDVAEKDILERTFQLADKKVSSLMTRRKEIIWFNSNATYRHVKAIIKKDIFSHYPVCDGSIDDVIGIVHTESFLKRSLREDEVDILKHMKKPLFIPESMDALAALEAFKQSGLHIALIIDEYGSVQGLITVADIMEHIVGNIPTAGKADNLDINQRDENTWLVDGLVAADEFKEYFHLNKLPGEARGEYQTVAGFMMYMLKKMPSETDTVEWGSYRAEVIDMDGNRVDKILLTQLNKRRKKGLVPQRSTGK